jgi:hypothetical protein
MKEGFGSVRMPAIFAGCSRVFSPALIAIIVVALAGAATAFGQTPPRIVSVSPVNGAQGVARDSAIVIVFDQEMNLLRTPAPSIAGLYIGNFEIHPTNLVFTGAWNSDRRTLRLWSSDPLPLDTTITWTINPPGLFFFEPLASSSNVPVETVSGSFQTLTDPAGGRAPKVESISPPSGATNISPSRELVFTFDLPMDTNVVPVGSFPPFLVGNYEILPATAGAQFQPTWSADGRELRLKPAGTLPAGTTVTWTLNPIGTTLPLKSAAGKELAKTNGTYRVIANPGANTNETCNPGGTNVVTTGFYTLVKNLAHTHVSSALVVPADNGPATFGAFVQSPPQPAAPVTNASITFPNGTSGKLTNQFGSFTHYRSFASETELDTAYPAGSYMMHLTQQGGQEQMVHMNIPASPSSIPIILNFTEAQSIKTTEPFILRWNAFTPSTIGAYINVFISDEFGNLVFMAPNPCVPRALATTDTAVTIPANYFRPGQRYQGTLQFGSRFYFSTNDIPQMIGNGNLIRSTSFTLNAADGGSNTGTAPARFITLRLTSTGQPEMTLSGTAAKSYRVQRSTTLTGANWTNVGVVTMETSGMGTITDSQTPLQFPLFYRAINNEP